MRRVIVRANETALVYRRGELERVLSMGSHWILPGRQVEVLGMHDRFISKFDTNALMKDERLQNLLDIVEVQDSEIGIRYRDGRFVCIVGAGKYAYWKYMVTNEVQIINLNKVEVNPAIERKILDNAAMTAYIRKVVVENYERAVLYVDGAYSATLKPGTYYFWKAVRKIDVTKVDLRKQVMEVNGQEILTKDKAAIRINVYAQYRVTAVEKAIAEVRDYEKQMYGIMQLAFRAYIGTMTLDELLTRKAELSNYVTDDIQRRVADLGVEVLNCGMKDVILPGEVKDIMNQVLVAEKRAQANVITRREETATTRSLLNTAKLMEDNEMLYRLKEMEYLEKVADKVNGITLSGGGQVLEQLRGLFAG